MGTRASPPGAAGGREWIHVVGVDIRFPDGSQTRPNIAIFCRVPDEQDSEITLLPEAAIEVLSKGYEAKDLQVGVLF